MKLMKNYFEEICKKLNNAIVIEHIEIVDNSHKHKGHKSFSPEKFHLQLKIKEQGATRKSPRGFLLRI